MAEPTNPPAGVAPAAPQSDEQRVMAYLARAEPDEAAPAPQPSQAEGQPAVAQQPEGQATELTPEDLPDPAALLAQPAVEQEIELTHNGAQVRLPREEVIKLAQQGFDYTQKTQTLAEAARQAQARLQRAQEIEQTQMALTNDFGTIAALGQQLQQYQNVNWMQLAATDAGTYSQVHAAYTQLQNAYNQASQQLDHKVNAVAQARNQMTAQQLHSEAARLPEFIPEWKDQQKYASGRTELLSYLSDEIKKAGGDPSQLGSRLDNALSVSIAWKAMQYDKLRAAKAGKVKQLQTLPPMTRPGAAQPANAAQAEAGKRLTQRLQKSGSLEDAAAILANRW